MSGPANPEAALESAEGHAFPVAVRWLVALMTAAVFAAGALAVQAVVLRQASLEAKLLIAAGLVMLVVFTYWVFKSRIHVDSRQIRQTWIWTKQVAWEDVVQAKMIYVPYLSWIIAPRLVVRGRAGMVTLFHAADPAVLTVFTRYALAPHLRQSGPPPNRPDAP